MSYRVCGLALLWALVAGVACKAQTSETVPRLKRALAEFPDADTNSDGILTAQEARAHLSKLQSTKGGEIRDGVGKRDRPVFETEIFMATAEELDRGMQASNASHHKDPLQFSKGVGLRILSTGHSWVGPALKTLPRIAEAAGIDGQHIRSHTGGGGTGSANSIWRKEFGKYGDEAARPILLPAIATGQWDVMTWGAFYGDVPQHYSQWIDVCLKANPRMTFLIQDGWPTFGKVLNEMDSQATREKIDAAQRENQSGMFHEIYCGLSERYPGKVRIIPAGAAVVEMIHHYYDNELPGFDCVSENLGGTKGIYRDGGHLSRESGMEWLVGYVYYGMLYHRSPLLIEGFQPPGVAQEVDQRMRAAAWNAITSSPYSGIVDNDKDGIGEPSQKGDAHPGESH